MKNKEDFLNQVMKDMKESLPAKRYKHTLGVAYTAASMAMCHKEDMEDAFLAGLLHDSAKYFSDKKMIEACEQKGLPISDVERRNPYLLHGKVGASIAKEKYHIERDDILNAITYHTTGRPDMSLLEQIIFAADYIEPGRMRIEGLEAVRHLAFHDLEECIRTILQQTIEYLSTQEGKEIDETTLETYSYYMNIERRI
ncbi:bis(5'-nucleosyl)-tetraphosphatase (symmetrical) YqeK [[Clostridium] polysaccharolyticum]|uniref:bis(5'-nucleosyl)-tetraphosphatase (symmetrical) n=1 Tax=[Clostridium] polysaccharolyticum TaxID=29364 RepID=A0A1I0FIQ6_9FIRM|nr:bis(5'-nucleosyl)-tetraphosphatase (symmetrical) YqeK [[Clostridium] polysaccharolyticum]SET58218.1 putative HD superfamily hydrolase of NAD metabolism [[Clostridium] polysaccharolyticum]